MFTHYMYIACLANCSGVRSNLPPDHVELKNSVFEHGTPVLSGHSGGSRSWREWTEEKKLKVYMTK